MKKDEQDPASQSKPAPGSVNHVNYFADDGDDQDVNEKEETVALENDEDSENNGIVEILQKEKIIDPGNEHHHEK